jgi:hypothetical protein
LASPIKHRELFDALSAKRFSDSDTADLLLLPLEPRVSTALPAPPKHLVVPTAATWLATRSRGWWLTSADGFLVEIAAALMARYRINEL